MDLSVLIPARNEMFLARTIEDVLNNIEADTEVIAVCDGAWPDPPVKDHERVRLIYHAEPIGQRAAVNEAARLSQAKYVMKLDAHCSVDKGFDRKLMEDCEYDWTIIPRMYNHHAFDWECKKCGERTYQGPEPKKCEKCGSGEFQMKIVWQPRRNRRSDFMRFDHNLKFAYWRAFGKRPEAQGDLAPTMSAIGACFFMHRQRFWDLDGMDEDHGSWGQFGTEVACKSWLSGGQHLVNKKTWFSHMFRTQPGFRFPYPLSGRDVAKARKHSLALWKKGAWPKAKHDLDWLIDKFAPVPEWQGQEEKPKEQKVGLVYYTDNHGDPGLLQACRDQILRCMEEKNLSSLVSVSQEPIDNFGKNFVMPIGRSNLSMFKQILKGLEECDAEIIFLLEHDVIYHSSHFDFRPTDKRTFHYDLNRWAVCDETGKAVFYETRCTSLVCAHKKVLGKHYRKAVKYAEAGQWKRGWGYAPPRGLPKDQRVGRAKTYKAEHPSLDIRREDCWTEKRMTKDQFRNERGRKGWTEAGEVFPWGQLQGTMDIFINSLLQE